MKLKSRGFILVTTLILMLVLSCITLPMLVQTHLSQKLAGSATLSFQLKQSTQAKHLQQLQHMKEDAAGPAPYVIAPCPASYAAWTEIAVKCEWYEIRTTESSDRYQHSITSLLVRQSLSEGGLDGIL